MGRINGRFGTLDWNPIAYQYKTLKFNEMIALYSLSDAGLLTPLRDGMNPAAGDMAAQSKAWNAYPE
ncbi:MAG: trehalose-6-phosphate synthase [Bacteroidales bacterium]